MRCGGCGAKVGATTLAQALAEGPRPAVAGGGGGGGWGFLKAGKCGLNMLTKTPCIYLCFSV